MSYDPHYQLRVAQMSFFLTESTVLLINAAFLSNRTTSEYDEQNPSAWSSSTKILEEY
jgi:hypothetical protein